MNDENNKVESRADELRNTPGYLNGGLKKSDPGRHDSITRQITQATAEDLGEDEMLGPLDRLGEDSPPTPSEPIDYETTWGDQESAPGDYLSKERKDAYELELEKLRQDPNYLYGNMREKTPVQFRQRQERITWLSEQLSTRRDSVSPLEAKMLDGLEEKQTRQAELVSYGETLRDELANLDDGYEPDRIPGDLRDFEVGAIRARIHLAKHEYEDLERLLQAGAGLIGCTSPKNEELRGLYTNYRNEVDPEKKDGFARQLIHGTLRELQRRVGVTR